MAAISTGGAIALGAASGAASGIFGGLGGRKKQRRQHKYTKELQRRSHVFNAEQARLAREFNSAEALKSREWSSAEALKSREFSSGEALKAREFSSGEALKARDFTERMSSTEYQRKVADMRAAGLNPAVILSGMGPGGTPSGPMAMSSAASGGAPSGATASGAAASSSTPGGAPGQHADVSAFNDAVRMAVSSALEQRRVTKEEQLVQEQIENLKADKLKKGAEAVRTKAEADKIKAGIPAKIIGTDLYGVGKSSAKSVLKRHADTRMRDMSALKKLYNKLFGD